MKPLHVQTPRIESRTLAVHLGRPVWHALQPPDSFKIRGNGLSCWTSQQRDAQRFISLSSDIPGIAVAYAGRQSGVPLVVMVARDHH